MFSTKIGERNGMAVRSFLFCLVISVGSAAYLEAEWPTYRCDPKRSGRSEEKLTPPFYLQWSFIPAEKPKTAWPKPIEELPRMHFDSAYHSVVSDGVAYFACSVENTLYAVKLSTGKVKWKYYTDGPIRLAPTIWKKWVYFGSDDGYVYCLNKRNGKLVWKYRAGPSDRKLLGNGRMISLWPVRTGVLVDDGVAYFGAGVFPYEGIYICALDAEDGSVIWRNDTIGDRSKQLEYGGISPQGYLVASEDILYVPSGRAMPAAFDRKTGKFLYYCHPGGKVGGAWAVVDDGELVAGIERFSAPAKIAYDEKTGKRKGDFYIWFPSYDLVLTPTVVYAVGDDGIYAVDRIRYPKISDKIGKIRAQREQLRTSLYDLKKKLPNATDEIVKANDGVLWSNVPICEKIDRITSQIEQLRKDEQNLKNLACKWEYKAAGLCSIIVVGDVVVAGGDGKIVALNKENGRELWKYNSKGKVLGLAAAEGYVLASTDRGEILCFGEKRESRPAEIRTFKKSDPYPDDGLRSVYENSAEEIIRQTGVRKGYCLVVGSGIGRLAYELAKRTDLKVVGIESDPSKVARAKELLTDAGLYGSRVVVENWSLDLLPDYFADLIVCDEMLLSGRADFPKEEMYRVLRPYGGVAIFGRPEAKGSGRGYDLGGLAAELKKVVGKNPDVVSVNGSWVKLTKGALPGAGKWTHLYCDPGNTACSDDRLVKAPLGVLWYGEPGPDVVVERHARAPSPLAMNGRFFIQGAEIIRAYNSYNGTLLWETPIPGAVRVRSDVDSGNLALSEDALYVAARDKCYRLDPETGKILKVYKMPDPPGSGPRRWGYVACKGNILYGSTAMPLRSEYADFWKHNVTKDGKWIGPDKVLPQYKTTYEYFTSRFPVPDEKAYEAFHRGGTFWRSMADFPSWGSQGSPAGALTKRMMVSDSVFALDAETGKLLWQYNGGKIAHITIALGDGMIFFADALVSGEERKKALQDKRRLIEEGIYEPYRNLKLSPSDIDVRRIMALESETGKLVWSRCVDLTGCGGEKMGAAYQDGILLLFGHFSNHDRGYFGQGALRWRRITALAARKGRVLWSRPLNYLRRPLIVGDSLIIEPRACDIRTGEIQPRYHPISNRAVPWEFLRPGHSCGIISASPGCIFYRSASFAIYDLLRDSGLIIFGTIRGGCWLDCLAANGVLIFPETSSGCTCSYPLRCTVVFKQRDRLKWYPWTVFITHGPMTPAQHFAINFGAPGDMKDDSGTVWFGYPRPKVYYGVKFDLKEKLIKGMGFFNRDWRGESFEGTDKPWLFASGCVGLLKCEIPLIDDLWGESPGIYTVRLGFAAPSGDKVGSRVFDIKLQGEKVADAFDIIKEAGGPNKIVTKEFKRIYVENTLSLELEPRVADPSVFQAPIINFVEVEREDIMGPPKPPPTPQVIKVGVAEAMLEAARAELERGNEGKALGIYHTLLDARTTNSIKLRAIEGVAAIGSPESLDRLAHYYKDTAPILWDYKGPDAKLRSAALKAYIAIAGTLAKTDPEKAKRMLKYALGVADNLDAHEGAAERLVNLGVELDSKPARDGYVTRWRIIGPFPLDLRHNTMDKVFIGEPVVDLGKSYSVDGVELKWKTLINDRSTVDLLKLVSSKKNVAVYAYAEVILDDPRRINLTVLADDAFKCWFNGDYVGRCDSVQENRGQKTFQVDGVKGVNTILLKVGQIGGKWYFRARLTDEDGKPIPTR